MHGGTFPEGDEVALEHEGATLLEVTGFETHDGVNEDGQIVAIACGEADAKWECLHSR